MHDHRYQNDNLHVLVEVRGDNVTASPGWRSRTRSAASPHGFVSPIRSSSRGCLGTRSRSRRAFGCRGSRCLKPPTSSRSRPRGTGRIRRLRARTSWGLRQIAGSSAQQPTKASQTRWQNNGVLYENRGWEKIRPTGWDRRDGRRIVDNTPRMGVHSSGKLVREEHTGRFVMVFRDDSKTGPVDGYRTLIDVVFEPQTERLCLT